MTTIHLPERWTIVEMPHVDSTNDYALRQIEAGAPMVGEVVRADLQSHGRGTRGREWYSPAGNFYASFVVGLSDLRHVSHLSFIAGLAVHQTVTAMMGLRHFVRFKWPNDLFMRGAKLGGILIETVQKNDSFYAVIGIGLNLVSQPASEGMAYRATSLLLESGERLDPATLLTPLTGRLQSLASVYNADGFLPIRRDWMTHALGLGQTVTLRYRSGQEMRGLFIDVDDEGRMIISHKKDGHESQLAVSSTDVHLVVDDLL